MPRIFKTPAPAQNKMLNPVKETKEADIRKYNTAQLTAMAVELGIDISDPRNAFDKENLLPILEKQIRENVQSQAPEMEEGQL